MGALHWAWGCVGRPVIVALVLTLTVCALLIWERGVRHD